MLNFQPFPRELEKVVKELNLNLPSDQPLIRFTECLGNTLFLSDMNFSNNIIWMTDLNGNVRSVAGKGGKGMQKGQFIQAAGVTADNKGNLLALCSKTSRVMAFKVRLY